MRYNDNKYENGTVLVRSDLHEQYYWLSSHRNMIGYSLYSLNARPPLSARQKPGPVSLHLGRSHCTSKNNMYVTNHVVIVIINDL